MLQITKVNDYSTYSITFEGSWENIALTTLYLHGQQAHFFLDAGIRNIITEAELCLQTNTCTIIFTSAPQEKKCVLHLILLHTKTHAHKHYMKIKQPTVSSASISKCTAAHHSEKNDKRLKHLLWHISSGDRRVWQYQHQCESVILIAFWFV